MIGDDEDEMICSTRVPTVLCGPFPSAAVLLNARDPSYFIQTRFGFAFSKEMGIVRKEKVQRLTTLLKNWFLLSLPSNKKNIALHELHFKT